MFDNFLQGILLSLRWDTFGMMGLGLMLGMFVGALPGFTTIMAMAVLLPISFFLDPMVGIPFLIGVYKGGIYGGSIPAILVSMPGTGAAVATTFDGRPLALKGRADLALVTAAVASFIGGSIANILFTAFAPPLAQVALDFGDPEIFALMLLAFATFVGLGGDDIPKTLFSICFGLVMAAVGLDIMTGEPRLVFGDITGFMHGINFLVLAIGVYGIGEMLWTIDSTRGEMTMTGAVMTFRGILKSIRESISSWKGMTIGSFLGFFVGILPAAGATPGSLMAYGITKMVNKHPEQFGKGHIDGVAAPESANNSASTGAMLPMLTLGIPGSPTTAILLGGMVIWGLQPGPLLFTNQTEFVWGLIGSFYISNFFALAVNLAFIPLFIWMLRMPFTVLAPMIFVLSVVGGFAATQDMHDIWLMLIFGLGAYLLRKLDYPVAPAVLAIVLGPIAEPKLRQSLLFSSGDPMIFLERPISGPITVIAIILILLPLFNLIRRKLKGTKPAAS